MPRVIRDHLKDIAQSIIYFLNNETFTRSGKTKTLRAFLVDEGAIEDLPILVGFPSAFEELVLPTLALVQGVAEAQGELGYGELAKELVVNYTLFGFAGGFPEDARNIRMRDQLMNDVKLLLEDTEILSLYTIGPDGALDTSVPVGDLDITNVSARPIPATGIQAAERARFAIDFAAILVRALDA